MKGYIDLKGIRVHNLKNIDLKINLNEFVVITGVSGSGKSSLAFDTLYAEGQRRYVESLSAYARQFMSRLNKPECDYIKGLPPAIAIQQKVNTSNPRSTVGTTTEIYDYLKLLYARMGDTVSPISGNIVKRDEPDTVVKSLLERHPGETVVVLIKCCNFPQDFSRYAARGFSRIKNGEKFVRIADLISGKSTVNRDEDVYIVVDRLEIKKAADSISRLTDSIETALSEGNGRCCVETGSGLEQFSNGYEADGMKFESPTVNMFSFNSPIGACPRCEGYGNILGIDEDLVIPDKFLSLYEDAVCCWRGEKMSEWKNYFIKEAHKYDFPVHRPYVELNEKEKTLLWEGIPDKVYGIYDFFRYLESKKYKIQNRVMIARYTGKTKCPDCKGSRMKPEASYVKINGASITDLVTMPIAELRDFFRKFRPDAEKEKIGERILPDIEKRLDILTDLGLGYLTLNRLSSTLSGGESQRINLASAIGSALVGSLYILDEPSIGLHSRDTDRLTGVLKRLRDIGNTVVVVEHDEDIIRAADHIVDIGPYAGRLGGEVVFQGKAGESVTSDSLTLKYLNGEMEIPLPPVYRKPKRFIKITGARENNLKNIDVEIPLGVLTAVTGVSGSGKTTLVKTVLIPALRKYFDRYAHIDHIGKYEKLEGALSDIRAIEFIDQNPIGKSSRSNPATYIKVWDDIRKLFADTTQAKIEGFKPSHFSFNVPGGRCEACQGEGIIKVEMQFMADLSVLCDKCGGKRFNEEVLEVKYKGKNIYDVLEMTVNRACDFFSDTSNTSERNISYKLKKLIDVGLGYIRLGQSSSSLSGGENQRVKLAYFLCKEGAEPTLFVFDEPTTGLHFYDIDKLMESLNALIERGHTVVVVEHNMDVIKSVDYIIDMGPEGGEKGGNIVFSGSPADIIKSDSSYTGRYLKKKFILHEKNS